MSDLVWTVTRTDYDGHEDEFGSKSVAGHFDTEEEAEAAADGILNDEDHEGVTREKGYGIRMLRDNFFDQPTLELTIESKVVKKKRQPKKKVAVPPSVTVPSFPADNKFGSMIPIPKGKPMGLRGAKCMTTSLSPRYCKELTPVPRQFSSTATLRL